MLDIIMETNLHHQDLILQSDIRFQTLAETTILGIFLVQDKRIIFANQTAVTMTGYSLSELSGMEFRSLISEHDRTLALEALTLPPERLESSQPPVFFHSARNEIRLVVKDGQEIWADISVGVTAVQDSPVFVITAYDITQRVSAENAHRELMAWMVDLQEEERRRTSRELHDQMGQGLTAMILGIKHLEEMIPIDDPIQQYIARLKRIAYQLSQQVHKVAFDLHPTSLEDLGLKAVLENYIEEWHLISQIPIDFQVTSNQDQALSPVAAVAAYRIIQEALTNITKHSKATQVSLILDFHTDLLRAIIEDNGTGFDWQNHHRDPKRSRHLGLRSMQERAELVGGKINIESSPGSGTTIYLTIPLQQGQGIHDGV